MKEYLTCIKEYLTSSGPADWISAIVGVFALFAVWIEYMRQKRLTRQQLAQDLSARFDTDEMIAFAVTTLDWGTGILVVPQHWREVVAAPALSWNVADIRDAVQGTLTETTRANPVRLLYRHAFVHLFNHIERIGQLEQAGALRLEDLRFVDWLAQEITNWRYAPAGEERGFFKGALDLWYPNSNLHALLERICRKFPKTGSAAPIDAQSRAEEFRSSNASLAADTFSILSLGTRKDADIWQAGVTGLGMQPGKVIKKPNPTLTELREFFGRSDTWLFIAGHFTDHLYNHAHDIKIWFKSDRVVIEHPEGNITLLRGIDFKQHVNSAVLFWGGCNVHSDSGRVNEHRTLFQKTTVMVGWLAITGWEIVDLNCGGSGNGPNNRIPNFFTMMKGSWDATKVSTNWLGSADQISWGKDSAGSPYRPRFSVLDQTGQEWLLAGDVAVNQGQTKGRKFS